jgi:hypothetical protein
MDKINTPFGLIDYVGDLLSKSYPTTVIFINIDQQPIIVEWLDEDVDGNDVFIIFKTDVENLKQFCNGIISHIELINNAVGKKYYQFAGSINGSKFKKINYNKIDKKALPKQTVYFDYSYSNDYQDIAKVFDLELVSNANKEDYFNVLKDNCIKIKSGLFRLHLHKGKNVGYGTADTKVLGQILLGFENLYHDVALDVIRGVDRNAKTKNLPDDVSINEMSSTEVFLQEAASYSVYIKSKVDTKYENENITVSEEIFGKINEVISFSTKINDLQEIKNKFSSDVFQSLAVFTETILDNKVILDLEYFNPISNTEIRQIMKPSDAHNINNNIVSYSNITSGTMPFKGQFVMLNTKTGYFVFKTKEEQEIAGYVDELIKDSMIKFNFTSSYQITVNQNTYETLNNKNKITYSLDSCLIIKD